MSDKKFRHRLEAASSGHTNANSVQFHKLVDHPQSLCSTGTEKGLWAMPPVGLDMID